MPPMPNSPLPPLLLLALAAAFACKPAASTSALRESGGTTATWRVTPTLTARGELTLTTSGAGSEQPDNALQQVQLQAAAGGEGVIAAAQIQDKRFLPLRGAEEAQFTLYLTTKGQELCYVKDVRISGASAAVTCKGEVLPPVVTDDKRREELSQACERLARTRIEGGGSGSGSGSGRDEGMYARYDRERNRSACTCLNGVTREVEYRDYYGLPTSDFEDACRRRASASDIDEQANRRACAEIEVENKRTVLLSQSFCDCNGSTLLFDDARYRGKPDLFRRDCLAKLKEPAQPEDARLAAGRRVCEEELKLKAEGEFCVCSDGRRMNLGHFTAEELKASCR